MNLPAVNIQTDSGADALTFLQVGPSRVGSIASKDLYTIQVQTDHSIPI
jgi:hypothetical protein